MAWLLRNSGNGYAYEAMERVVTKKNTDVYLEVDGVVIVGEIIGADEV